MGGRGVGEGGFWRRKSLEHLGEKGKEVQGMTSGLNVAYRNEDGPNLNNGKALKKHT